MEQTQIEGIAERIIFRSPETGYTVLELITEEDEIVCVGNLPSVSKGENLKLTGSFTTHATYGEQFKVEFFEATIPSDALSMERYLGSGAIKGIGQALATRIVKKFGADTKRILEEEPERLSEIKGISESKARDIAEQTAGKKDLRDAMLFLAKYGINGKIAVKIYEHYHESLYEVIRENPYRMADEVRGIGFRTADEIAERVGIKADSEFRIKSGILYVLTLASGSGNTYLPKDKLYSELLLLLRMDIQRSYFDTLIDNLKTEWRIREMEPDRIYLSYYYRLEDKCADMLLALDRAVSGEDDLNVKIDIDNSLKNMSLEERQVDAIESAAKKGVSVLTGGPGTGKTTAINGMIRFLIGRGEEVLLAAPTGRAAKRMTEATGYEAKTIHRMLEVHGISDDTDEGAERINDGMFERNSDNPLEADVIIIDEMSMVDISVFYALLSAIPEGTRLVLVGDINQLPSVGPGNVLKDIINSDCFTVTRLEKIFRQAAESDIVMNAHKINRGEEIELSNKSRDFFFLERKDAAYVMAAVWKLVAEKLPKYVDASISDIQVMSPMKKGALGTMKLNDDLQMALNPPLRDKNQFEFADGKIFRVGDKVMQTRNDYKAEWEIRGKYGIPKERGLGVFNGDTGVITGIDDTIRTISVMFDENKIVEYPFSDLDELELAYAITIHKSQGSEYPAVIIPLIGGPRMLLNRNLLYTAVTRAKKCVVLVGSKEAFLSMINNEDTRIRYSGLKDKILSRKKIFDDIKRD